MNERNKERMRQSFGDVPDAFARRVEFTAHRTGGYMRRVPIMRTVLIAALMLVLLAGSALALYRLGLLDSLHPKLKKYLQPGAEELVQTEIVQEGGTLPSAQWTVEEALYDGRQVYVVLRIAATNPQEVLLMDFDAEPAISRDWWVAHDYYDQDGETFSKAAYDSGRALVQIGASDDAVMQGQTLWANTRKVRYDGEDILYTLTFPVEEAVEAAEMILPLFAHDVYKELPEDLWRQEGELRFTVSRSYDAATYTAQTPIDLPKGHMTLNRLTLEQTPIASYLTLEYGLKEGAPDQMEMHFADGLWWNWLDENGELVPDGTGANGLTPLPDGGVRLSTAYRAFAEIPDEITLECFSGMTKERFDTITVSLTKEEEQK